MKMRIWSAIVMSLGIVPSVAAADSGLAAATRACEGVPLSFHMRGATLGRIFSTLEDLSRSCGVRFEVAPDVASRTATLELKDVKLATVLDVMAGTHDLAYSAEGQRVSVRAKGNGGDSWTADGDRDVRRRRAAAGSSAPSALLKLALVERVGSSPRVAVVTQQPLGAAGDPCAILNQPARGSFGLKLDAAGAVVRQSGSEAPGFYARICPGAISAGSVELRGEVIVRYTADEGRSTGEERRVFERTLGEADKHLWQPGAPEPDKGVSLFKSADGVYELKLLLVQPVKPAAP
jgi:hypothetical protein